MKSLMAGGIGSVKHQLLQGVIAAFIAPDGIFIFAWCARQISLGLRLQLEFFFTWNVFSM